MPKDISSRSSICKRDRNHPYKCDSGHGKAHEGSSVEEKDWEDATCPICMDFPHNAVLLLCTSHDKGCRPYMCNSSHRHSNCLDQYRKFQLDLHKTCGPQDSPLEEITDVSLTRSSEPRNTSTLRPSERLQRNFSITGANEVDDNIGGQVFNQELTSTGTDDRMEETDVIEQLRHSSPPAKSDVRGLVCPLCRGTVTGWRVVDAARDHLNMKPRCCARESCSFTGTYSELCAHARSEHPLARPCEVDPARQREWRHLEHQRDLRDVLSTIRSAMPGATVLGDYVIEDVLENENGDPDLSGRDGHWWTVFLLFQVFGPATVIGSRHVRSRIRNRIRGHRQWSSMRNVLWGENLFWDGNVDTGGVSGRSDADDWSRGSHQQ